jgi:hypothetical protein
MGCRGPDARVVRPTAAGEGGRQGEFLQGSANLCGAVVYEADLIRFALHIGSSVFLPFFFVLQVVWITGASRGIGELDSSTL